MKISIVGTGYVGLVTGTCFSETGINVTCVDIDKQKIQNLNEGKIPIYEPGLEQMISKNREKKHLLFSTDLKESLVDSEVVFIAVGTPPNEDGSADLKHVLDVAKKIGEQMDHYLVIATKSTVPVGTAKKVKEIEGQKLFKALGKIEAEHASVWKKILKLDKIPEGSDTCSEDYTADLKDSHARETRAIEFYKKAAEEAENERVKQIFEAFVEVESDHLQLSEERLK